MDQSYDSWFKQDDILINSGTDSEMKPVYLIVGKRIDKNEKNVANAIVLLNNLVVTNQAFRPYFILYLNNSKNKNETEAVKFLKSLNKLVPELQLRRLSKFVVVAATVSLRSAINTNLASLNNLKTKINYVDSLSQLTQQGITINPRTLQVFQAIDDNATFAPQIRTKKFYERALEDYPIGVEGVPQFLIEFIAYFKNNEQYLRKEGVFRISGSVIEESKLEAELAEDKFSTISKYQPEVVATVFKKVFDKLKYPLIPYHLYEYIKTVPSNISNDQLGDVWQKTILQMDNYNRAVLLHILRFLGYVSQFSEQNKMGFSNLSIVFAPCFLRPEVMRIDDMARTKIVNSHFAYLIENQMAYQQYLGSPAEYSAQIQLHQSKQQIDDPLNNTYSEGMIRLQLQELEQPQQKTSLPPPQSTKNETKKKWYQRILQW